MNRITLRATQSPYGDYTKGSVLSQNELDGNFIYIKGETIYSAFTSNNDVTLKKYNGNDISFTVGGNGNKWYIPSGDTVVISENYESFIYGDFYVFGSLYLDTNSKLVVLNGNIYVAGTITGPGDIYTINLPTFDTFVTGGTYSNNAITFTNNTGGTFSVTGIVSNSSPIMVDGSTLYSVTPATSNFSTSNSIFFGENAGYQATNAYQSNFFGPSAGYNADGAYSSNFFGPYAGFYATNANESNFLGSYAGFAATNAYYSNFIGYQTGQNASNASYSNLFGYNVGNTFTSNNIGSNNIIIGTNISLPDATSNAINIGGVLFGLNTNSNTGGNPSITPSTGGKIGIQVVTPTSTLDINGDNGYSQFRLRTSYTPSSSGDTNGNIGDIAWDNTYIYIKTDTGWGRTQLDYSF